VRTVWKYPLHLDLFANKDALTTFKLPVGGKIRSVQMQAGCPTMWVEVVATDPMPEADVTIAIVGTGHEVPDNSFYLGTCIDGMFVWHFYHVVEANETRKVMP
jgi:hypothetical protein